MDGSQVGGGEVFQECRVGEGIQTSPVGCGSCVAEYPRPVLAERDELPGGVRCLITFVKAAVMQERRSLAEEVMLGDRRLLLSAGEQPVGQVPRRGLGLGSCAQLGVDVTAGVPFPEE